MILPKPCMRRGSKTSGISVKCEHRVLFHFFCALVGGASSFSGIHSTNH